MKRFFFFFTFCFLFYFIGFTQIKSDPFIKLTDPLSEVNFVTTAQKFIIGSTCKTCTLTINNNDVKVFPTGAFVYELTLPEGESNYTISAKTTAGKPISKTLTFTYSIPKEEQPTENINIDRIQTLPEGNLMLKPGDAISFKVKAKSGCTITTFGNTRFFEMPDSVSKGMIGIYQGKYVIQPSDTFINKKFSVILTAQDGTTIVKETNANFSVLTSAMSDVYITKGRLAHLEYGLGEDRLGGAKIGYIDSLIPLKIIGKVGSHFKVKLAPSRTAYIPDELVNPLPPGTFMPSSLTGKIKVFNDSIFDVVQIQLFSKLPYQSFHLTDPSKIVVDIFGATSNTNWIDQLSNLKEVKKVNYEQIADDIFRVYISLQHQQHWGHQIYYSGNNLIIKIKPQPKSLLLKDLTIAIDAGHGGTNTGAVGPTGVAEKEITLPIALKLQKMFEKEGAKVIMTRTTETFFDNKERILFYRDSTPDLLLSIHLNSSADPIHISGTSTFYRYDGFKNLSNAIQKRMLELGLKDCGNNGSFNFMLNSPIEYPNALIETVYLSNPEEEMKILDPVFQEKLSEKIVLGVKDFLGGCR
jgi:N-acetylmuramoyl-L-alanine amidase